MRQQRRELAGGVHSAWVWGESHVGPSIVALHGFSGSGADWAPLARRLEHRVVAPDLLGHGDSPAPESAAAYGVDAVVQQAAGWCDSTEPCIVMGYSMGGRVALRLARHLGERVVGLVLISTSPGLERAEERRARASRDHALADQIEAHGTAWFTEHWSRQPIIRSQEQIPEAIHRPMRDRRLANRPHGLAGSLRGMGQGSVLPVWDDLTDLDLPTLWLTGDEDRKYTRIAERAVALLPRGQHTRIPGAGHCTHLEALDPVAGAVQRFLAEQSRPHRPR